MAHFRTRDRVQIIKLEREIWIVTEFDKRGNPKKCEPISASEASPWALVAIGSGEEQEVKWMDWDEAMRRYEPEEEIGMHTDEPSRAAARRHDYDDPRRDGYREPRWGDTPYHRRDDTYLAPPPSQHIPPTHAPPPEPYRMPTLLPSVAVPSNDEQKRRAESV